jgi:hypothetical protein
MEPLILAGAVEVETPTSPASIDVDVTCFRYIKSPALGTLRRNLKR